MQTMLLRVVADLREGRTGVCDTEVPDARVQWAGVYGHRGNGNY